MWSQAYRWSGGPSGALSVSRDSMVGRVLRGGKCITDQLERTVRIGGPKPHATPGAQLGPEA